MNLGLSNLLGELLNAEAIDYNDCRDFQVVCPACREPVFKAVRTEQVKSKHYLSHYAETTAYQCDCELRVGGISEAKIQSDNVNSREQRLKYFLSVVQEATERTLYKPNEEQKRMRESFIKRVNYSKAIRIYRDLIFEAQCKVVPRQDDAALMGMFTGYVEYVYSREGGFYETAFAIDKQKRIGLDMYRHINTALAKPTFDFLWGYGYFEAVREFTEDINSGNATKDMTDLRNIMANILMLNREQGLDLLRQMQGMPVESANPDIADYTLYMKLSSEIMHQVIGILIRLPYFKLLKDAQTRKLP